MTCSECGSREGPTGLTGLKVREWECKGCGTRHDRDINAARVILKLGSGCDLVPLETEGVKPPVTVR